MCERVYEYAHILNLRSLLCLVKEANGLQRQSERRREQTDENHLVGYPRHTEGHIILENQPLAEISKAKSRSCPQAIVSSY